MANISERAVFVRSPVIDRAHILRSALLALRPHQWVKNVLLFVPALSAHQFGANTFWTLLLALVSFSLAASAGYLVNDLIDLPHDRNHPEKSLRPLAAGQISAALALGMCVVLLVVSATIAVKLNVIFASSLAVYIVLSLSYSLYLKRKLMIDVVALAALYGIRVIAGGIVTNAMPSDWLVGFCFFVFLSLALVKRTTELMAQPQSHLGKVAGRGYRRADVSMIAAMMVASGFIAVLVLALYINSSDVRVLYHRPVFLWPVCAILTYWLGRLYVLTERGEMRQDPVLFASKDRISLIAGGLISMLFVAAMS
ncbi:UbiA family prenyltransferase [Bradyrhizobium guangdongense]